MSQKDMIEIAAVLTTLNDLDTGSPESVLYLGLNTDLNHWQELKAAMLGGESDHG